MASVKAIEARGFAFRYPESTASIGPLDWTVEEGAFQLLVGATGSGKTTLLSSCKPAIAPAGERAGALRAFGRPVDELDAREAAATVGYVAQSPENQIVCDSVWHELAFGLENLGVEQDEMRRRVAEVAHFFGIEPWFRRSVAELSGGQKQMTTLAGTLAMQPRLLLLDEPTAQLDPVAEKNFLHALFRVNRELGITVVVATHAPEAMAEYATDTVELRDGRMRSPTRAEWAFRGSEVLRAAQAGRLAPGCDAAREAPPAISLHDIHCATTGCRLGASRLRPRVAAGTSTRSWAATAAASRRCCVRPPGVLSRSAAAWPTGRPRARRCSRRIRKPSSYAIRQPRSCASGRRAAATTTSPIDGVLARFGLDARVSNHPYDLSGGQQQLLAFAKLLLTDPDLLLLDEPTKGLDAPSKLLVARTLRDLAQAGATVVLATHDLTFAALVADAATMLFDGEAVCTEPAAAFFAGNLFYRPTEDAFSRLWREERS